MRSLALEEAHRIERRRALADLEVQLRRVDVAGLTGTRNYLSPLYLVTTLHLDCAAIAAIEEDDCRISYLSHQCSSAALFD